MSNLLEELKKVREAFKYSWNNMCAPVRYDDFTIPANGLTILDDLIEAVELDHHWLNDPSPQDMEDESAYFAEWLTVNHWRKGRYRWYQKNDDSERHYTITQLYKIYKSQKK